VDKNEVVRWSGSLFTHDAEKVLHRYYGKPVTVTVTVTETKEEPRIVPTREPPKGAECVGGVCRMPARKLLSKATERCKSHPAPSLASKKIP
jgi:hypothetical protein